MAGVPLVERAAAFQIDHLDAPKCVTAGQGAIDLFGQRRRGEGADQHGKRRGKHAVSHLPVTFDSSQIRSKRVITTNVPSSGTPTTTPTPRTDAAYPRVAG